MSNPESDKDNVLRDLSAFVSSSTPTALMTNPTQTGEFLTGLSSALREQLDEVERLAAGKGAKNNVTQDVLKEQQESLRIVTEKLGLPRVTT